jgi:uncharacterized protein (DUF2147 family)
MTMRKMLFPALAALALCLPPSFAFARSLEGTVWRTASGSGVIRIVPCGTKVCGNIVNGTPRPGETGLDSKNPNPALRKRPLMGLPILTGFTARPDGKHVGGQIYNPEDGRTYRSEFRLKPDGKLEVKGCVGPICQAQIWTPAS